MGDYFLAQKDSNLPYQHLRDLSRIFKDNIANRLLCKLLEGTRESVFNKQKKQFDYFQESGERSNATLIGLPNEIKVN